MPGRGSYTIMDYTREKANIGYNTAAITAGTLPGTLTQIGALRDAIDGITLGTLTDEKLLVFDTNLSNTAPTNELAQVETAWLVQYEDSQAFFDAPTNSIPNEGFGKIFTVTIPTADVVGRLLPESEKANPANAQIAAFIAAWETLVHSPYGGTVNVLQITHVGRNR